MGFDVLEERVVVLGEAEEEVGLADLARLGPVQGTSSLRVQVLLVLELLAALAVEPDVLLAEQHRRSGLGAARVPQAAEQLLHRQLVALVRGADELVVRHSQRLPGLHEGGRDRVHEGLRGLAGLGRGARDLLAVLVGAGQEEGLVAALAVRAGEAVGQHLLVGVAQVGAPVHVVDGGGDVEASRQGDLPGARWSGDYRVAVQRAAAAARSGAPPVRRCPPADRPTRAARPRVARPSSASVRSCSPRTCGRAGAAACRR